jgi:hypothetical protein
MFEKVRKGRFYELRRDGKPVEIELPGCRVTRPPYVLGNSLHPTWYIRLDVSRSEGLEDLLAVGREIERVANAQFSPIRDTQNVVARLSLREMSLYQTNLDEGVEFDAVVKPGNFGNHGWFLHVVKVSPPQPVPEAEVPGC